jgi:hypothetical protein
MRASRNPKTAGDSKRPNGEPGGARTRDHRIKSASAALFTAPICTKAEFFRIGGAGECTAFLTNGGRHGVRRGFDGIRPFPEHGSIINDTIPFPDRAWLNNSTAQHARYSRRIDRDQSHRSSYTLAIFVLETSAPFSHPTLHMEPVLGLARSLSRWLISSHSYRHAWAVQEFL